MVEKFNSKTYLQITFSFFEPLRLFDSKFTKSANMIKKNIFFKNVNANAKFDADFEYVEKVAKDSPKKRYEQQKIWYLIFISVCKGFRRITSIR